MDDYTRTEQYLNGILNGTPVPEPYTREEKLLAEIAEKKTNAGAVPYDNTTSGLTATNVQAAIDEVAQGGGGGGAGDFVVEFSITMDDPLAVTSNKTYAEVDAAYKQGQNIKGKATLSGVTGYVWLTVVFVGVMPPSTDATPLFLAEALFLWYLALQTDGRANLSSKAVTR